VGHAFADFDINTLRLNALFHAFLVELYDISEVI